MNAKTDTLDIILISIDGPVSRYQHQLFCRVRSAGDSLPYTMDKTLRFTRKIKLSCTSFQFKMTNLADALAASFARMCAHDIDIVPQHLENVPGREITKV
jgi:hypothetical protein